MLKRIMSTLAVVVTGALALSGCASGGGAGSSDQPVAGGDITIARSADVVSLLPTAVGDNPSIWTQELIYDTLLVAKPDGSDVEPSLAESYKVSDDQLTWTLKLRDGVKFSDGTPLKASDAKWSLERASQPDAQYASFNKAISTIDAPDDTTLVIHLTQPWAPFAADLALFANSILPANYGGKTEEEFAQNPIGTGPFKFDSWEKGQYIKLAKNDQYWKTERPYLDSVTFTTVNDSSTRLTQVKSGEIDVAETPAFSAVESAKTAGDLQVGNWDSSRVDFLTMNHDYAPLSDVHVRRAISYAIDRESIVNSVLYGNGTPGTTFLSPAIWGHDDSQAREEYDMGKAKDELAQSGYANGFDVEILTESGDDNHKAVAQIIQESLKQLGINVSIKTTDPTTIEDQELAGNFQLGFVYRTTDIIDPDQMIRKADSRRADHALYSNYSNDQIKSLVDEAAALPTQDERKPLYAQVQQIATDDAFVATLYYTPSIAIMSDRVHGFGTTMTGNYTLADTWIG